MDQHLEKSEDIEKLDAAVILPFRDDRILLQLRDFNKDIIHPGKWGFFGGSIEKGELPEEAAKRELWEEISFKPKIINLLGRFQIKSEYNKYAYVYYCKLDLSLEELKLGEGLDFGLFTLSEISTKKLYSKRMNKYLPLVNTPFVLNTIKMVLNTIS